MIGQSGAPTLHPSVGGKAPTLHPLVGGKAPTLHPSDVEDVEDV